MKLAIYNMEDSRYKLWLGFNIRFAWRNEDFCYQTS